jgi:hypothetical protein
MKAYGNQLRVEDPKNRLQTFDSGISLMFEQQIVDARDQMYVHYVGVLKDTLKLDYGYVQSLIIFFRYDG